MNLRKSLERCLADLHFADRAIEQNEIAIRTAENIIRAQDTRIGQLEAAEGLSGDIAERSLPDADRLNTVLDAIAVSKREKRKAEENRDNAFKLRASLVAAKTSAEAALKKVATDIEAERADIYAQVAPLIGRAARLPLRNSFHIAAGSQDLSVEAAFEAACQDSFAQYGRGIHTRADALQKVAS